MRKAIITRKTNETDIVVDLCVDGRGEYNIDTGSGFLNHMLELFARHGRFDLTVSCSGDTGVDYHHSVEDIAIVLGRVFKKALGDFRGIARYGFATIPMDEALITAAVDISGRGVLVYALTPKLDKVGDLPCELIEEFMGAFSRELGCSLHLRQICGENSHHIIEGAFKALARALCGAVTVDEDYKNEIPSTKGIID